MATEIRLTNEERVLVTLNPVTKTGKKAPIDGTPVLEVISGDGSFTSSDDGNPLVWWLNSGEIPGDTVILIRADARLGSGVVDISETVTLHVETPDAANLGLVVGVPEAKPA